MTLYIDRGAISENAEIVRKMCEDAGVQLQATLKTSYCCDEIILALREGGVTEFCTTSLHVDTEAARIPRDKLHWIKLLPVTAGLEAVVRNCATSLHSELETIARTSDCAAALRMNHQYIISVDIGDRRDGVVPEEFGEFFQMASRCHHQYFGCGGFSVNHTCCEMAIPTEGHFDAVSAMIEPWSRGRHLFCNRSVGGSVVLGYHLNGGSLKPYNQIRVGGALITGEIEYFSGPPQGLNNPFRIVASVLEIKDKHHAGGVRRRAIVDIGSIHTDVNHLQPEEADVRIVGNSGEYTVLDITEARQIKLGEQVAFKLSYQAMARSMSSTQLHRVFL